MKVATVFALLLVSANAFTAPQFATRAVGAPTKKVAAAKKVVAKKVVAKKVAPVKAAVKKAAPKAVAKAKKVVAKAKKVVVAKKPLISQIKSSKVGSGRKSKARPDFEMLDIILTNLR